MGKDMPNRDYQIDPERSEIHHLHRVLASGKALQPIPVVPRESEPD
jgi:hypothetical protein